MRTQDDGVTIQGHPGVPVEFADGREGEFTICADCGALASILWLTTDRWRCSRCKSGGRNKPRQFFMSVGVPA